MIPDLSRAAIFTNYQIQQGCAETMLKDTCHY